MRSKLLFLLGSHLLAVLVTMSVMLPIYASIADDTNTNKASAPEDVSSAGIDAYIYGYPLVTMEMTRRVMTNVSGPIGKYAPVGQFAHLKEYPTAADKEITAPNADTLYSLAWLDVSKEPYILSIPDAMGRYYLMPMLDAWTDVFANPGARTTGTKAQKYAITGPNWSGQLPSGITEYKSPTSLIWILGRTYCTGTMDDYTKVYGFQDGLTLTPLSSYGKEYVPVAAPVDPNFDTKTPVRDQVNQMSAETYFQLLAQLLKDNPPSPKDADIVSKMAKIGIVPGHDFDINQLDLATASSLYGVPRAAQEKIMAHLPEAGTMVNGWTKPFKTGKYSDDYLQRAFVTAVGLGANLPEDAIYPTSHLDSNGQPFDGTKKYVMHFAKGQTPPVNAFWSLTMYDDKYFFVPNTLNRVNLSSRSPIKHNSDGSIDIYIQKDSPGKDKQTNWLPAPEGKFVLMLRMYWPKEEVIAGKYTVPPVTPVN